MFNLFCCYYHLLECSSSHILLAATSNPAGLLL